MADQQEGWMIVSDGVPRVKIIYYDGTFIEFICGDGATITPPDGWVKPNLPFQSPPPSGP